MKIPIVTKDEKVVLLKALQTSILDTDELPVLKQILNSTRPDLRVREMSDSELDAEIKRLEKMLNN